MLCDRSNQNSISQTWMDAEITLRHSLAILKLLQTFQNTSEQGLEVTYIMPIDTLLVINSLKAHFQDKSVLECKIMEKEQAKEKFQDKLSKGHFPILGTAQNENLELSIGLLPSGHSLSFEIEFVFPLQVWNNGWKFEMPEAFTSSSSINYQIEFCVHSEVALTEWRSSWDFDYSFENYSLKGFFSSQSKGFNSSKLDIYFRTSESPSPKILVQHDGERYAAILSFIPSCSADEDIDDYELIGEFLFIIDRSGSMSGNRIELAKEAATLFLKSLNHKSKFNIVSFGDSFSLLYPESVIANSANVSDAISKISIFSADMGGTEIFQPLDFIYQKQPETGFARFIFLLTDGDVSSPDMVLDLVMRNQEKGRVYSFGIEDANEHLIKGAAKNGNGESFYIKQAVDIGKNVIKALSNCISPFICDVKINWDCEFAPKLESIKCVTYGSRFCVFALGKNLPDTDCVLTCFDSFKNKDLRFEIKNRTFVPGNQIFKLWANQRILDYPDDSLEISLTYQVISPKTAYFLSKRNTESLTEDILPAQITSNKNEPNYYSSYCLMSSPVNANISLFRSHPNCLLDDALEEAEENDELFDDISYSPDSPKCLMNVEPEKKNLLLEKPENIDIYYQKAEYCSDIYSEMLSVSLPTSNLASVSQKKTFGVNPKIYLEIVLCQDSKGFWQWESILEVINGNQEIFQLQGVHENLLVVATSLALAYLNKFCLVNKDEWVLVEKKAVKWIKKEFPEYNDLILRFNNALE